MTIEPIAVERPFAAALGATSLSIFRPRLKTALLPLVRRLFATGVRANHVTLASIAGSIAIGALLLAGNDQPMLFLLLPLWLAVRMALASIDGTLAMDFGQKSRLGGILNEGGDIVSEMALWLPLAVLSPVTPASMLLVLALVIGCEVAGWFGVLVGHGRRVEGPLGKADRSLVLGATGLYVGLAGRLPNDVVRYGVPLLCLMLLLTIVNRLRFASHETRRVRIAGDHQ